MFFYRIFLKTFSFQPQSSIPNPQKFWKFFTDRHLQAFFFFRFVTSENIIRISSINKRKFAKNTFSRILKSVAWGVELWQCCTSFSIPSMYVFKWCKYEYHAPDDSWEICFQPKKSLIFSRHKVKSLKEFFRPSF